MKRYLIGFALVSSTLGMATAAFAQGAPVPTAGTAGIAEEGKKNEKVPYYGLTFDFTAADGTGLNSVGENYRNDLVFYFEPSWNVGARYLKNTWAKTFAIAARLAVTQELAGTDDATFNGNANSGPHGTCSNITPSTQGGVVDPTQVGYCHPAGNDRRADYSDLWITFKMPRVYTIPKLGVTISPSVRFVAPTSLESRYNNLALSITPSLGLGRSFWKDRLHVGYSFGFTGNIRTQSTASLNPQGPSTSTYTPTGNNYYNSFSALSNFYLDPTKSTGGIGTQFSLLNVLSAGATINDKWSIDLLYILVNPYYNPDCNTTVNGQPFDLCASGSAVAANSGSALSRSAKGGQQIFWLTVGYQPLDYLGIGLAYITSSPTYNPDSSYRQGIFSADYNAFTTVQLSATLTIDKLVSKFRKN